MNNYERIKEMNIDDMAEIIAYMSLIRYNCPPMSINEAKVWLLQEFKDEI